MTSLFGQLQNVLWSSYIVSHSLSGTFPDGICLSTIPIPFNQLTLTACDALDASQYWTISSADNSIRQLSTNYCITATSDVTTGAFQAATAYTDHLIVAPCTGSASQVFSLGTVGGRVYANSTGGTSAPPGVYTLAYNLGQNPASYGSAFGQACVDGAGTVGSAAQIYSTDVSAPFGSNTPTAMSVLECENFVTQVDGSDQFYQLVPVPPARACIQVILTDQTCVSSATDFTSQTQLYINAQFQTVAAAQNALSMISLGAVVPATGSSVSVGSYVQSAYSNATCTCSGVTLNGVPVWPGWCSQSFNLATADVIMASSNVCTDPSSNSTCTMLGSCAGDQGFVAQAIDTEYTCTPPALPCNLTCYQPSTQSCDTINGLVVNTPGVVFSGQSNDSSIDWLNETVVMQQLNITVDTTTGLVNTSLYADILPALLGDATTSPADLANSKASSLSHGLVRIDVNACVQQCTAAGVANCQALCNQQAASTPATDQKLTTYCAMMNSMPVFQNNAQLNLYPWSLQRRIGFGASQLVVGPLCAQERTCGVYQKFTRYNTYDWQPPAEQITYMASGNKMATGEDPQYQVCLYINRAQSNLILWNDGPSIPDTLAMIKELVGDGWAKVLPPFRQAVANALSHYRDQFWWVGVNHDNCYHHEPAVHQYSKEMCDTLYQVDANRICDVSQDRGYDAGFFLDYNCKQWAQAMYNVLHQDKYTLSAWMNANVQSPYERIDVQDAWLQQHQRYATPANPADVTNVLIYKVEVRVCTFGDGKDVNTAGSFHFQLSNGRFLPDVPFGYGVWRKTCRDFASNANVALTPTEWNTLSLQPSMDFQTVGWDSMDFDLNYKVYVKNARVGWHGMQYTNHHVQHCGLPGSGNNDCKWRGEQHKLAQN